MSDIHVHLCTCICGCKSYVSTLFQPERPVFVFGGAVKKTAELKSPILRKSVCWRHACMYSVHILYSLSLSLSFSLSLSLSLSLVASIPSIPQGIALTSDVQFAKVLYMCTL